MTILVFLFAHLLADYPLQGEFLATMKGKNFIVLFSHAGIWTGVIATTAYLLGFNVTYLDITLLFVVHAIADYAKARPIGFYKKLNPLGLGLLVDQLIHVLQILLLILMQ
ncbi:DUF3307 domain-containing protein [Aneurinibacillus migulanus]|uniref:DUF3307 domain-containing protein n=1 Tax=Aneurinibacillus migulanus TaxID=47500 RepID=UPI0020A1D2E1|nr:DUF3307 domain-containing protein [Aneurinibacillus migulanus]MCP1354635.1 DUF3307 domain-containing protein [Aneurinibacillus migulanus]